MNKTVGVGRYLEAFELLMKLIDQNEIAFGKGQYWALGKL